MNPTPDRPAAPHATEPQAARAGLPRRALLGAAAATALGAGVTMAWMQGQEASESAITTVVPDFWSLQWNTPDGTPLSMQSFQGRPLLVNFWATWCPPCVEELPLINAFYQQNKGNGWQVLGLAVDKVSQVKAFLTKVPLAFPVGMAGLGGTELSRTLGNVGGGLPFTFALDRSGSIVQRKMGQVSADDLQQLRGLK